MPKCASGTEQYQSLEIVGDAGVGKGQKRGAAGSEGTQQTDHDA